VRPREIVKRFVRREFDAPQRSFAAVLVAILVAMTFELAAPDENWARLMTVVLQGVVVLTALSAAGADQRLVHPVIVGILMAIGLATGALVALGDIGPAIPKLVALVLVLIAPMAIVIGLAREFRADKHVTLQTVLAGLSIYLLIGMAFAFLFGFCQDVSEEPFFAGGVTGSQNDFLYFSLATLTTTGYGDFTAAFEIGRTFAVLEALTGQIYLVTVVALLVSNLRREPPAAAAEQSPDPYRRT
jgi:voltage-gated potassium channel Kch